MVDEAEEIVRRALATCDKLWDALKEIETSVQTARTPIEEGELDFVTVRGELIDMDYYLMNARNAQGSVRHALIEVMALVRRLQHAYHTAYLAWQSARKDASTAAHDAELNMMRRLIADLDQDALDVLNAIADALATTDNAARTWLQRRLDALLQEYYALHPAL
jgi:hypothetical protein